MRKVLYLVVAAFLTSGSATAESTIDGLACFENLNTPEFPAAALKAHIDGSVWTWTHVTSAGSIEKIETQVVSAWGEGPKLLTPPVEKAIRAARIRPECAGKTAAVIFRYALRGEAVSAPKVTSRTEGNIMWIESQPATNASK